MIETTAFAGMAVQFLISILVPVGLIIYWGKKGQFSWKAFLAGMVVFILFAQVLEAGLHVVMIDPTGPSLKMTDNPYVFALYGGLAAAIFEEFGRYFALLFFLKRKREFGDGVSLGIGHGGIEAVLVGAIMAVNMFVYAMMINAGTFESNLSMFPADQVATIKQQVIDNGFGMYLLGGIERVAAIVMQIMFSLMVLLGVRRGKFKYVLYAIGLHFSIDFFVGLYQAGTIKNIFIVEALIIAFALLSFYIIKKLKGQFN
ncbi:YhfC family intramembrane metalloprotease [Bacillus aerolatus]|uniref:YhfC family intramembrane metalloprotease n=1 Tax=Bacillus aerolatus TaxID=2653354 RepID=A0A6I1FT80_9BACI|nr:YhfC family intramembrane metalloprotease [Bacillus aerolatus]KAB7705508.1 YhfC family intramembrane metalloprotease [Bacillus aerolatus]